MAGPTLTPRRQRWSAGVEDGVPARNGNAPTWIAASAFLVATVALNWSTVVSRRTETGDFAADSLRSLAAWTQTDGVFSRWGYHHPGPVLFWLKSASEALFSLLGLDPVGAQLVGCAVLATVSLALLSLAASGPRARTWTGPVTFLLAFAALPDGIVLVPWGPVVGNWFLLLALAGVAASVRGRRWGPPVAAFGALGLLHLHVLFVPLALALLAGLVWAMVRRRPGRVVGAATVLVCVVMLAPMVVAVVRGTAPWGEYVGVSGSDDAGLFRFSLLSGVVRVFALLAPSSQGGGATAVVGLSALIALAVPVLALLLVLRGSSAAIRVVAAGGLLTVCFLVGVSRMDFLTGETIGRALPVLVLVAAVAELGERLPRRAWAGACAVMVGAMLVSTLWRAPVDDVRREGDLRGTGTAESALQEFVRSGADLLVIDHRASAASGSYASAASTALLAARSGVSYCVAADRYPHWVVPSMLCPSDLPANVLRVMFTSRTEFQVG